MGCHGNASLSLMYGSFTDELSDSMNPISKPDMTHTTDVVAIFVIFLPILAKNWLPSISLRPLQSEMFS